MTAWFNADGTHRLALERGVPGRPAALWVMLNPSTADAETDDPTIRRVRSFSHAWGWDRQLVVNLFSFRATDPKDLKAAGYPTGDPVNALILDACVREAGLVVAAWGANAPAERVAWYRETVLPLAPHYCLGTTKAGAPRHPLYVAGHTTPELWT